MKRENAERREKKEKTQVWIMDDISTYVLEVFINHNSLECPGIQQGTLLLHKLNGRLRLAYIVSPGVYWTTYIHGLTLFMSCNKLLL